jgi:hypothetical protein
VPTLPANLILNDAERGLIVRHIGELEACSRPTSADDQNTEEGMLVIVTRMMLVLPAARQNEASAEARGEAYMTALDDLPEWAVIAAVRRWYRGDAGDKHDYRWCPAPAELCELSRLKLWRVQQRARQLRELLSAEPLIEYSEEHSAMMRERFAKLLHRLLKISPVGNDGSGGKVNKG